MNKLDGILLVLLAALGITAAAIFWSGPYYQFDDMIYVQSALGMLSGHYLLQPAFAEALTIMGIALSLKLFGISQLAAALPALASYVGIVLIAFLLGRRLYGYGFGLVSASFVISAPFILPFTTRALPDLTSAFAASLSIYLFILAVGKEKPSRKMLFASGIAMGLAPGFKATEGLLIMGIFVISVIAYCAYGNRKENKEKRSKLGFKKIINSGPAWVIAGILIPTALIALFFYLTTGVPFFNIVTDNNFLRGTAVSPGSSTLPNNLLALGVSLNPLYYFIVKGQPIITGTGELAPLGILPLLAIAGAIAACLKRNKTIVFLSIIGLFCFFYLFFGSQSYSIYTFLAVRDRYFTIAILPLSIVGAYPLSLIYRHAKRLRAPAAGMAIVATIIALSVLLNLPMYKWLFFFNLSASNTNQAYLNAINEAASQASLVTLYLGIPNSNFRIYDILLLARGNPNINILPTMGEACDPGAPNPFLIEVYTNQSGYYGPESLSLVREEVENWESNCTLAEVWSNTSSWSTPTGQVTLYSKLYSIS